MLYFQDVHPKSEHSISVPVSLKVLKYYHQNVRKKRLNIHDVYVLCNRDIY